MPGRPLPAEAAAACRGLGAEQVELGCSNSSPAPHVTRKRLMADVLVLGTGCCWIPGENGFSRSPRFRISLQPGSLGRREPETGRWQGHVPPGEQLGVETVVRMSGSPGACSEDRTPHLIVTSWPPGDGGILRYQWKAAVPVGRCAPLRARDHG